MKHWSNTKTKKYGFSSGEGFIYVLLIIIAINLTVFNFSLISSNFSKPSPSNSDIDILQTVNAELKIFQQIIRNSNLGPGIAMDIANVINSESKKYRIEPFLVLSVIQVESGFRSSAVSNKGAIGIVQIMPRTGKYIAKKYNVPYKNYRSLYDPVTNVKLGIAYLSYLKNLYDSNMEYALFAYNNGPRRSEHIKRKFKNSRPYYVKKVMNFKQLLKQQDT